MKKPLLLNYWPPLTIFQLHATMCCSAMFYEYKKNNITDHLFCYNAKSIYETNTLILWGSISLSLINIVVNELENTLENKNIIHIQGCEKRIDNKYTYSSLNTILPITSSLSGCTLTKTDYQEIIAGARQCLRA